MSFYMLKEKADYFNSIDAEYYVKIKWTDDVVKDYHSLGVDYYECGCAIINEIIKETLTSFSNHKGDNWTLVAIYLLRHAIELELKSIICKTNNKTVAQDIFVNSKHNLFELWNVCSDEYKKWNLLSNEEIEWNTEYISSIEKEDCHSTLFRFPFNNDFLGGYRNAALDVVDVANNLIQSYNIVSKFWCIEMNSEYEFCASAKPEFLLYTNDMRFCNCCLWQPLNSDGFHHHIVGYMEAAEFLFEYIAKDGYGNKMLPVLFVVRNAMELCLKRFYYVDTMYGNLYKRGAKGHNLNKLWKRVYPVVQYYTTSVDDKSMLVLAGSGVSNMAALDPKGSVFRYPTTYSFEYNLRNMAFDAKKIFEYFMGTVEFLDCCRYDLKDKSDYEIEMFNFQ